MGKTSFSGPVYGAKATLFSAQHNITGAGSTGSSAAFAGTVVPPGEDWYATELLIHRGSTGSSDLTISVLDDSTNIGSAIIGIGPGSSGSTVAAGGYKIIARDGGEYEGVRIASGSVVTFAHSNHAGPNIWVTATLRGFTRFVDSSRAE